LCPHEQGGNWWQSGTKRAGKHLEEIRQDENQFKILHFSLLIPRNNLKIKSCGEKNGDPTKEISKFHWKKGRKRIATVPCLPYRREKGPGKPT